MAYRNSNLGGSGALGERLSAAVGIGLVYLLETEALVLLVLDLKTKHLVGELACDIKECLVSGLEEGGVPGASAAGKLVACLLRIVSTRRLRRAIANCWALILHTLLVCSRVSWSTLATRRRSAPRSGKSKNSPVGSRMAW